MRGSDSDLASWMCRVEPTLKGSHLPDWNQCKASETNCGTHALFYSEEKGSRVCTFPTLPYNYKHCGLWLWNDPIVYGYLLVPCHNSSSVWDGMMLAMRSLKWKLCNFCESSWQTLLVCLFLKGKEELVAWPLHTAQGEERLAETLRGEQGAVCVCSVRRARSFPAISQGKSCAWTCSFCSSPGDSFPHPSKVLGAQCSCAVAVSAWL